MIKALPLVVFPSILFLVDLCVFWLWLRSRRLIADTILADAALFAESKEARLRIVVDDRIARPRLTARGPRSVEVRRTERPARAMEFGPGPLAARLARHLGHYALAILDGKVGHHLDEPTAHKRLAALDRLPPSIQDVAATPETPNEQTRHP